MRTQGIKIIGGIGSATVEGLVTGVLADADLAEREGSAGHLTRAELIQFCCGVLAKTAAPLWIVGQVRNPVEVADEVIQLSTSGWEIQGLFGTEAEAAAACPDDTFFIGPVNMGEAFPHESVDWPGAYWPKYVPEPVAGGEGVQA